MTGLTIGVVIEGQGDQLALPPLIRRIADAQGIYGLEILQPFRVKRGRFSDKFDDFEKALTFLACMRAKGILVVLDADDDCPVALSQGLKTRAVATVGHIATAVVVANREFETWLLAGIESIRGFRGVESDATCPEDLETIRGAKGRLESMLTSGTYSETVDQSKFACAIDLEVARGNSRSFDKFLRELDSLLSLTGLNPGQP